MPLDRIDLQIIRELQNNVRISNKELAAKVNLAPSTCLERVRHLWKERTLLGCHLEVDPAALGITLQAMIAVRLQRHTHELVESFQRHLFSLPEVVRIFHMAGSIDFLVHVAVKDANHLRNLAVDGFTTRKEVGHIETSLIFSTSQMPPSVPK